MISDTVEQVKVGQRYGIEIAHLPYSVSLKYRTWNHLRTQLHNVIFEIMINEPGTFEVNIHN